MLALPAPALFLALVVAPVLIAHAAERIFIFILRRDSPK
jgi:hypothetical protein